MIQFIEESQHERAIRRLLACTHTLHSIADELEDPENIEHRGDLLIAVENLIDVAIYVTEEARGIAWQHTPEPADLDGDTD